MSEPYYQILLNFVAYIQLLAAVDFGLLILENRSITVKFQKKILELQKNRYKPLLNEAGDLTRRCQERIYGGSDEGRVILGLAERIRKRKEVFLTDTELEMQSAFMPALGLTSGLFCIAYLLLVPLLVSSGSVSYLYWLEYITESVITGQLVVILTYMALPQYRGYLTSLVICVVWTAIVLILATVSVIFGWNITLGGFGIYEFLILLVPSVPVLFLAARLIVMYIDRSRRIVRIQKDSNELSSKLQL